MSFLFGSTKTTNSSTTPTLTGQGQDLYQQLLNFGTNLTSSPSAGLQPIQAAGEEQINSSFGNIPAVISKQMASRGYGSSGSMGDTMYQTQLARLGALGQFQGNIAGLASQRQMQGGSLMEQLLGTQVGSTGTSKTTTMDPSGLFSALGTMLMMGGGGGFSGPGSDFGPGGIDLTGFTTWGADSNPGVGGGVTPLP